jgi:hypothetical protein
MHPVHAEIRTSLFAAVALSLACGPLCAGPIGSEGSMGLSAGYQSNPLLLSDAGSESETLALLLHLPVAYTGDRVSYSLQPRLRAGATRGAVAPLSDYQYVDSTWDYKGELNEFSVNADWHRDSTLYNQFEQSALAGSTLHRQEEIGALNWRHQLSERSEFEFSGTVDRVRYGAPVIPTQTLNSFNYNQAGAKYSHDFTERWQVTAEGGLTGFELADQRYRTDTAYGQLGLTRNLSQRWSLAASVGTAHLKFRQTVERLFVEPDAQGVLHLVLRRINLYSHASTRNYSLTMQRQFQRWRLELSASQALQPSGFGVLATQDDVTVRASGNRTERLSLSAAIHGSKLTDASGRLSLETWRYYDVDFTMSWRWTEHWTVQSQIALYLQRPAPTEPMRSNTALFLTLSRELGRKSLN